MSHWLPFTLFAVVASITPGPTNLLILAQGTRGGWKSALPAVLGASVAAALIVLTMGCGLANTLLTYPLVRQSMTAIGVVWLSWLAWRLCCSPSPVVANETPKASLVFGARQASSLQLINPKTWMMALSVVGVFSDAASSVMDIALLAITFGVVAIPCLALWALMGSGVTRLFRTPRQWQWFNRALAVLLFAVAWWSVLSLD